MLNSKNLKIEIPAGVLAAMSALRDAGGRPFVVGGAVRDAIIAGFHPNLGIDPTPKDMDVEVFGLSMDEMLDILKKMAVHVDEVGKRFGVLAFRAADGSIADFSLPRIDTKVSAGHGGFDVEFKQNLDLRDAASRRDFTINALMLDPFENVIFDFFGGVGDIRRRLLRPIGKHFRQDVIIRVLRGMQFASRFDMFLAPDVDLKLFQDQPSDWENVSLEAVAKEWMKWASKGLFPANGIDFLHDANVLHWFPEIAALVGVEQDPINHPEGDVFIHTTNVLEHAGIIARREKLDEEQRARLFFGALAHDFGKPETTSRDSDGHIHANRHESAGVPIWREFARRIGLVMPEQKHTSNLVEAVAEMVEHHMAHGNFRNTKPTPRAVRRLSASLNEITLLELSRLVEADSSGRPPLPAGMPPAMVSIMNMAAEMGVAAQKPVGVVMGRHLVEMGFKQGKIIGVILKAAFDAQIDGVFSDLESGLKWVEDHKSQFSV